MTPEAKILKQIIKRLRHHKEVGHQVWWIKVHGNPQQLAGVPDLLICWHGQFVGVEVKREGGRAAPLQWYRIDEIRTAGGVADVCQSAAAVDAMLFEMLPNPERKFQ